MSTILFRRIRGGAIFCPQIPKLEKRVIFTNYSMDYRLGRTKNGLCASESRDVLQTPNTTVRTSSSDVYQLSHEFRLHDIESAKELINHFRPDERTLLLTILLEQRDISLPEQSDSVLSKPTFAQLKHVFIINTIPFIGFGILDNMIMLLAGEYIDQTLGALLGISTMAAAALGNIISDVAGVGLAHYVEKVVSSLGFSNPDLSPKQFEMKNVRFVVNGARAFGLVVGCIIGMFPLLFFKSPTHESTTTTSGEEVTKQN